MTNSHDLIRRGSSLFFEGRAWLDKSGGNTYHSVRIWLNGSIVAIVPFRYGYENAYQVSAVDKLVELGYLPEELEGRATREYPVWQIARKLEIVLYSVLSYGNKSELFREGK